MKKRLYNVIFPVWALVLVSPLIWTIILPANFLIETIVLLVACVIFKLSNVKEVYKKSILKMFFCGLLSDLIGAVILIVGSKCWYSNILYSPFASVSNIVYISICVIISSIFIYVFNYNFIFKNVDIKNKKRRQIALFVTIFTAPYLFFYPAKIVPVNNVEKENKAQIENTYLGNTLITRIFAESYNYTNTNFEYSDKINKVKSEISSNEKSVVTTQISANFEDSDINEYIKWAKQCSIIVMVKDGDIETINVNLADAQDENKIKSNLVFERKNIEEEFAVKLTDLQDDQNKLQEILDVVKKGE